MFFSDNDGCSHKNMFFCVFSWPMKKHVFCFLLASPSRHVPKAVTDPLLPCLTRPWEVNLLTTVARQR
jgi:hypothetical protein